MIVPSGKPGLGFPHTSFILLGILITGTAFGQPEQQPGEISGTVMGLNGERLSNASVILSSPDTGATLTRALTDADGRYTFDNLRYGTYALAATMMGYNQAEPKRITVVSASEVIDFTLTPLAETGATDTSRSGNTDTTGRKPPVFSPAGIQGTIAPSGYSTGLSQEETSQVMDRVGDLDFEDLSAFTPPQSQADCGREPDLLAAVHANPEGFAPNHALGVFYFAHGDFIQSINYLKRAYAAMPADTDNSRALALAFMGAGQSSDAVSFLERVTEKTNREAVLLRLLAIAYEASGSSQKAAAEYRRAATLDLSSENLFACGVGMIGLGTADEAANLFASATNAHPDSAKLWMGLGIAQDLQKRKTEAIPSLLRAISIDPNNLSAYSFLAGLSGVSPETDAQIRDALAGLVVARSESAVAHYDYALALWRQRAISPVTATAAEIESQLRLALTKDPKMTRAHFLLGMQYADSGNYENAATELREAVQADPVNAQAHYRLAQVYRRDKKDDLANKEIAEFMALHGDPASDENGPEADLRKLAPQLSRQMPEATPCHGESR